MPIILSKRKKRMLQAVASQIGPSFLPYRLAAFGRLSFALSTINPCGEDNTIPSISCNLSQRIGISIIYSTLACVWHIFINLVLQSSLIARDSRELSSCDLHRSSGHAHAASADNRHAEYYAGNLQSHIRSSMRPLQPKKGIIMC